MAAVGVLFSHGGVTIALRPLNIVTNHNNDDGMLLEISRGMGPRTLQEWLRQNHPALHLASPHYSAYKQNLVLVLSKQLAASIRLLSLTCVCLVQDLGGILKPNDPLLEVEYPISSSSSLYKFPLQLIRLVPSNQMRTIAMVKITIDPTMPTNEGHICLNKIFRRVLKANRLPVLGSAKLSVPFRGESLCMGLVSLVAQAKDSSIICHHTLEIPSQFHALMDREDRFATNKSLDPPMAYQLSRVPFDGLELFVTPEVMIPRKGSETVVVLAERLYRQTHTHAENDDVNNKPNPRILDLGTGSGCLLLALLRRFPNSYGVGLDCATLDVARRNAQRYCPDRCEWYSGTFADPPPPLMGRFDVIVSNPPYHIIGGGEGQRCRLNATTVQYEPHSALFVSKDEDPIRHYRDIIASLPLLANDNCVVAMEIFRDNAKGVTELCMKSGVLFQISIGKDTNNSIRSIQSVYHALGQSFFVPLRT